MKTVSYNDYQASVEYEDGLLFVKVLHIDDLLIGECESAKDAPVVLKEIIDEYLADCADEGREPQKPFKGTFNVRIASDLHRRAAMSAAGDGITLNAWVQSAIEEKLECSKLSDRIDGVFNSKRDVVRSAMMPQWKLADSAAFAATPRTKKIRFESLDEGAFEADEAVRMTLQRRALHA